MLTNIHDLARKFIKDNDIGSAETIWQKDGLEEPMREFVEEICEIVGYADQGKPSETVGRPISPADIVGRKETTIPAEVFDAFSEIIAKNWTGNYSSFLQKDVVKLILQKMKAAGKDDVTSQWLFDNHWLDVEPIYRKQGWAVSYDKPGFNESYEASFEFKKRGKKS